MLIKTIILFWGIVGVGFPFLATAKVEEEKSFVNFIEVQAKSVDRQIPALKYHNGIFPFFDYENWSAETNLQLPVNTPASLIVTSSEQDKFVMAKVIGLALFGLFLIWGFIWVKIIVEKDQKTTYSIKQFEEALPIRSDSLSPVLVVEANNSLKLNLINWQIDALFVANFHDAQKLLQSHSPDLIICDASNRKNSSIHLLKLIRSSATLKHIHVCLLGEEQNYEQKLYALVHGADEFLSIQMDPQELKTRISNLVNHFKAIRQHYQEMSDKDIKAGTSLSNPYSIDKQFVANVYQAILEHYHDESFNVSKLAALVYHSRSNLFRKVKELTGQTPNSLIRLVRIEKSAQLLKSKAGTISEIAFSTGFSSLSYFSKVFTATYGTSPKNYMETQHESGTLDDITSF
ncbi:helix-turn-helix domain-containing protein [Echinicola sp. CAU 1574]|uniref:Helix-turn-helix domain-containing protein n=1 Tax=Echinicola arenosa TaxID=2774144 RepID=A0ABR9AM88_9BACT|nr:helix-turn-helix domain-containing protein [Echinicola arenosa]